MEAALRTFRIGYAACEVEGLFGSTEEGFVEALERSWRPGTAVSRYGRNWQLAVPHATGENWLGRIGFVTTREQATVFWDPSAQDFVRGAATSGVVVPFAIEVGTGLTAFQMRPGVVRTTTFTGALQALFNENRIYRWAIRPLVMFREYEAWRQANKVTAFTFRLERPNPDYRDDRLAEEIVEGMHLEVARLAGRAAADEEVNTDSPSFRQLLDHVRREYGRGVLQGSDVHGELTEWHSAGGGTVPAQRRVTVPTEEEEIPDDALVDAMGVPPGETLLIAHGDVDDEEGER